MNGKTILELAKQAGAYWHHGDFNMGSSIEFQDGDVERFAELIVKECINTLEFHGFDDAVPYIKWMATNKLGVKE